MKGSGVDDIMVFLAVVEAGSFVSGGRRFGLSRSAAGKAIARLEAGYGTRLLNRTTRSLDMTEEGRVLFDRGVEIRDAIAAANASLAAGTGAPRGTLRVSAPDALGRQLILPVVQAFLAQWPDMRVALSLSDRVDSIVEDGFDIAIRIGTVLPDTSLVSRRIWAGATMLCAAPGYLADHDRPARIENLTRHTVLQFASQGARQGWRLQDADGAWARATGQNRLYIDSAAGLRDAALRGLGIALLPQILVAEDLRTGRLEQVLPQTDCGEVSLFALYPHKRLLEPRVRRFLDLLVETLT
ncbi:LysR family transcriptional regulator [Actibacterium sp. 188UL27-1]|uniref:LysR family transcriptional regulator n=1 Tax=Actibacterium sp. 188UL27-1 TaxID=2786961 RepID=UPI001957A284|nr:LysR family transcriptional regulator [Actibacterium sp. 188UL27-1]MBM7069207.1 LysR family transcriptional regulator [Actibacterium sp. 188UL27-1]